MAHSKGSKAGEEQAHQTHSKGTAAAERGRMYVPGQECLSRGGGGGGQAHPNSFNAFECMSPVKNV